MYENWCAWGGGEARLAVFEGDIEHRQRTDVQPPAADQRQDAYLDDGEHGDFDDDVAEAEHTLGFHQAEQGCDSMQKYQNLQKQTIKVSFALKNTTV